MLSCFLQFTARFALIINTRMTLSAFSAALSSGEIVWQRSRPDKAASLRTRELRKTYLLASASYLASRNCQMYVKIETKIKRTQNSEIYQFAYLSISSPSSLLFLLFFLPRLNVSWQTKFPKLNRTFSLFSCLHLVTGEQKTFLKCSNSLS